MLLDSWFAPLLSLGGWTLLLYALPVLVCWWFLSIASAEIEADRQATIPPDPRVEAEARRHAEAALAQWLAQDRAERARTGHLSEAEAYADSLTAIRAQIAAQNRR